MSNDAFLSHHGLTQNPFRGEEASNDHVFERVEASFRHPDFEKILGDLDHPSSSVVFGERGSGKTAIRLQIERILREREEADDGRARIWPVSYADFGRNIQHFMDTVGTDDPTAALKNFTLVDHMDAILGTTVPRFVDGLVEKREGTARFGRPTDVRRRMRALPVETRRRLLHLQICYDRSPVLRQRTKKLRRLLRLGGGAGVGLGKFWTLFLLVLGLALGIAGLVFGGELEMDPNLALVPAGLFGLVAAYMGLRWMSAAWRVGRCARRLVRAIRVDDRSLESFKEVLVYVPKDDLSARELPLDDHETSRYMMFDALIDGLQAVGYDSMMVLLDRLDEPKEINGDTTRMKAFIWPVLNNKFLQMRATGFKLLLPVELREEVRREREGFFREARLDKQHLIDRLAWSGSMLYDLCNARFRACSKDGGKGRSIMELFDEGISRQDIIDALDQLQQPRDAFKFMYALIHEHASNNPEEEESFRIPRATLELVRKREVQRKDAMLRGHAPA